MAPERPSNPRVLRAIDQLCYEDSERGGDGWTNAWHLAQHLYGEWADGRQVGQDLRYLNEGGWLEHRDATLFTWWAPSEKAAAWMVEQDTVPRG